MLNYDKERIIEIIEKEGLVLSSDSSAEEILISGDIYLPSEEWDKIKKEIRKE